MQKETAKIGTVWCFSVQFTTNSCTRRTCEGLMSHKVSSLAKAALSLEEGGKMTYFRQALIDEILSREIQVIEGKNAKTTSKILMLEAIANGDWRVAGCLQHAKQQKIVCSIDLAQGLPEVWRLKSTNRVT